MVCLGLALLTASRARRGAADPVEGAVVRADPVARARAALTRGSRAVTVIDLRDDARFRDSVAQSIEQSPGVSLRSLGDPFAATSVTLRGATGAHVVVALDGVVLNDAASDGVDLNLVAPALLERATLYRGAAPLHLGGGSLGGAIELHTRSVTAPSVAQVSLGFGAFGTRRAAATVAGRSGPWRALAALGYRHTDGDFSFYDTDATPDRAGQFRPRRNNRADAVDLLARLCHQRAALRPGACLTALVSGRARGVPGVVPFESEGPFFTQSRALVRAELPLVSRRYTVAAFGTAMRRADRFVNDGPVPLGYGTGDRSETLVGELGLRAHPGVEGRDGLHAMLRARHETFRSLSRGGDGEASRSALFAGLEAHHTFARLHLDAGLGLDALVDARDGLAQRRALLSPRLGARVVLTPALSLRATLSRAARAPSLGELYGDRGSLQGNPALVPESAYQADLGAVFEARRGRSRVFTEVALWGRRADDLIALAQTSRATLRPFNTGAAWLAGVELDARLQILDYLEISVSYALTESAQIAPGSALDGRALPFTPRHDVGLRASYQRARWRAGAELSGRSAVWLERANVASVPGRALVGAHVMVALVRRPTQRVWLRAEVNNLLNLRTLSEDVTLGDRVFTRVVALQDSFGYPLPGRSVSLSLSWDYES